MNSQGPSGFEDLIPAERQARLREWFDRNVSGSVQELARMFNTSISTLRRDLDALVAEGLIRRTHGGAVSVRNRATFEPSTEQARLTAIEEKRAIAEAAARRLVNGQSLLLDTGSTTAAFAHLIAAMDLELTVVTQDLQIAGILSRNSHIRLIVPGGICRPRAYTLFGEHGLDFMSGLRCDWAFLTAQAMDHDCLSDTLLELVRMKRAMIAAARVSCVLIDSSRLSSRAIHRVADLAEVHEMITDTGLGEDDARPFLEAGLRVTRVSPKDGTESLWG